MKKSNLLSEKFLFYIWKHDLFFKNNLTDDSGNIIEILNKGIQNSDAGPDFFNAKIKIGETTWAGNVEIHINSSDWNKHKHNNNKAYDNVILHVVYKNDTEIYRTNGEKIPTIILKFDKKIFSNYSELINREQTILCLNEINKIDSFTLNAWLNNVLIERLERKTDNIKQLLQYTDNNWTETFYIILARSFGFNTNSEPFELLAKSLASIILAKHRDNILQLEALLFGQAGMLVEDIDDEYYNTLKKEYKFLKSKYKLKTLKKELWKFLRLRPVNFPTIRISQFAELINKSSHLFSKILESKTIDELKNNFNIETSEYWQKHYTFGKESDKKIKVLGKISIDTLIINTVIPIIFIYGKIYDNEEYISKAFNFLENLKAEKNSIIKKWTSSGITVSNAFYSQALLQLHKEYCLKKRCLDCRIANKIIVA